MYFKLNESQKKRVEEWNSTHKHFCDNVSLGTIGGRLTYSFTPTGLGEITKIKCACGEVLDVTEYEKW